MYYQINQAGTKNVQRKKSYLIHVLNNSFHMST